MEATELRTKNLVLNDKCICEVIHIYGGSFTHCALKTKQGNEINANYALLKPIPLTEEILLKCGFKRKQDEIVEYVEVMYCHPLYLRFMANNWTLFISENGGWFHTINYLHQLQNLYFALTGQELEINL